MTPEQRNPQITTARVAYALAKQHENDIRRGMTAAKRDGDNEQWQKLYNELGDAHRATARARRRWTHPTLRF